MKAKAGQIAVLAAGVLAIAWTSYRLATQDTGPKMADELRMVDVTTGELFIFPLSGKGAVLPELNPTTGKRSLLPIVDVDGKLVVTQRALGLLSEIGEEPKAIVDRSTGEIRPQGTTWTTLNPS